MADRGVVNAAEVLAGELRRKMGAIPADRVSRRQVTDLLASGDGGPVVIFPDGTVKPYPTLSEGEKDHAAVLVTLVRAWEVDPNGAARSQDEGAAEDVVRLREALEAARSFVSEVAGDDCPHAAAATRELHRIAAALAGPEVVDASMAGPKWVEAVTPPPVPDQTGSGG